MSVTDEEIFRSAGLMIQIFCEPSSCNTILRRPRPSRRPNSPPTVHERQRERCEPPPPPLLLRLENPFGPTVNPDSRASSLKSRFSPQAVQLARNWAETVGWAKQNARKPTLERQNPHVRRRRCVQGPRQDRMVGFSGSAVQSETAAEITQDPLEVTQSH